MQQSDSAEGIAVRKMGASKLNRRGPRSRLSLFDPPSGSFATLSTQFPNDEHWFERYGGFLLRDSLGDETCAHDLSLDSKLAEKLRETLRKLSENDALGEHLLACDGAVYAVPPFPAEHKYGAAVKISHALMRATRRNPQLVRLAICAYVHGLRLSDRLFVLRDTHQAHFGRAIIDMVRLMGHRQIRWRIAGFKTGTVQPQFIPPRWRDALRLPSNTPIHWIVPKNKANASSNAGQIAIQIVEREGNIWKARDTFYSVMLYARVVEIWRLITPVR